MSAFRIIVRSTDSGRAAHVGGEPETRFRTFVVECPELEAYLRERNNGYCDHSIIGIERIEVTP